MLVGSKAQLKSLNVDEFISNYEGTPLELVEKAKYLGMSINSDISWDFHVQRLCQNLYYYLSLLRRLRRLFPKELLLQVYKNYICNVPSGLLNSRPPVSPEIIYLINIPNIESHLSSGSQVLHQYYGSGVCYF